MAANRPLRLACELPAVLKCKLMKDFGRQSLWQELRGTLPRAIADSPMIERSFRLAFDAHKGQLRESCRQSLSPLPYIVHPVGVAKLTVRSWVDGELTDSLELLVCAALLHDVLEDTSVAYADILKATSPRCAELVLALTKPETKRGRDRGARNSEFVRQIKAAGASAVFVKICDCLQNLSRPGSMPRRLLTKTVEKAKGPYSGLLLGTAFESRLRLALANAISSAEDVLELEDEVDDNEQPALPLHLYLEDLARTTRSKQPERHDIVEILSQLPGVLKCLMGSVTECVAGVMMGRVEASSATEISHIATELMAVGHHRLTTPVSAGRQATEVSAFEVVACELPRSDEWVCVLVDRGRSPHWLTSAAVKAVLNVLQERSRDLRSDDVRRVSPVAVSDELDLMPDGRLVNGPGRHDLIWIVSTRETASFVLPTIRRGLERLVKNSDHGDQMERIEGRIKNLTSILRKVRDRRLETRDVDDVLGLRIVLVSREARDAVAERVRRVVESDDAMALCCYPVDRGSIKLEDVSSGLGYRAKHLRFRIITAAELIPTLSCEVQFRTVQEDAWARVSELLAYKTRSLSRKKSEALLRELAKLRDQAELEIDDAQRQP